MKYLGYDDYLIERGEPSFRSCWECNSAHEHLRERDWLHYCFVCGRHYIHGHFLDEFGDEAEMDAFLRDCLEHTTPEPGEYNEVPVEDSKDEVIDLSLDEPGEGEGERWSERTLIPGPFVMFIDHLDLSPDEPGEDEGGWRERDEP